MTVPQILVQAGARVSRVVGCRSRYNQQKLDVAVRDGRGRVRPDLVQRALNVAERAIADRRRAAKRAAVTASTWENVFRRFLGTDALPRVAKMWVRVFDDAGVRPTDPRATIQNRVRIFEADRYEGRIDADGIPVADAPVPMKSRRAAEGDVRWLKIATRWASGRNAVGKPSKLRKVHVAYPDPPYPPIIEADPLDDFSPMQSEAKTAAASERRYRLWLGHARRHRTGSPGFRRPTSRDVPYGRRRSWLYEMLVLANDTGRRIGSIRHLRVGDVHLDDVDIVKHPFGTITWPAKYDKISREWERVPILTRRARRAIERTLRRLERYNLPTDPEAWLFPSVNSFVSPVSKKTAGDWLRRVDVDLPPLKYNTKRWHSLRAKWATDRKDRANLVDVAWAGGWESVATLQDTYQKTEPERAFAAAA